ncbi:helix-turn-helix domain-containing protein [Nocardia carnea]|uniref:Helix-turn-helix domain-containing protein n=1 Tax=Nocardia carnea TaxID=37328 RepID=A0ABW7TVA0_9NOCA
MLLRSFQTWFDTDCSTKRAAAALDCHANTVRNRLRRIDELTGRSFGKSWAAAELAVALEASDRPPRIRCWSGWTGRRRR